MRSGLPAVALEGCRVPDPGSGSGRDVYALAQLVGPTGEVAGVDMTDEQLAIAEQYRPFHVERLIQRPLIVIL